MNLTELSNFLNNQLGTTDIHLENGEACSIIFEDNLETTLEPNETEKIVTIYANFCNIPQNQEQKHNLYEAILKSQLFGVGTFDHMFSIDQKGENIILHRNIHICHEKYEDFLGDLNLFFNVYKNWKMSFKKEKLL